MNLWVTEERICHNYYDEGDVVVNTLDQQFYVVELGALSHKGRACGFISSESGANQQSLSGIEQPLQTIAANTFGSSDLSGSLSAIQMSLDSICAALTTKREEKKKSVENFSLFADW